MGTKINAIWWNIKVNLQKLVDTRGYERQQICKISREKTTEMKYSKKF